jgi:uncharacterized protein (TIGR03000 family)
MMRRVSILFVLAAAVLWTADTALARHGRGGCGGGCGGCGGGCYSGGCYGGGCYGGGCYGGGCYGGACYGGGCSGGVCAISTGTEATVAMALPADATLIVNGQTIQTNANGVFRSPALESGYDYHYTVTVRVVRNGQTVEDTQRVTVRAGEQTQVNFNLPETTAVASR